MMLTRRDMLLALTASVVAPLKRKRLILVLHEPGWTTKLYFHKLAQLDGDPDICATNRREDAATIRADSSPASLQCFKDSASFSGIEWQWEVQ